MEAGAGDGRDLQPGPGGDEPSRGAHVRKLAQLSFVLAGCPEKPPMPGGEEPSMQQENLFWGLPPASPGIVQSPSHADVGPPPLGVPADLLNEISSPSQEAHSGATGPVMPEMLTAGLIEPATPATSVVENGLDFAKPGAQVAQTGPPAALQELSSQSGVVVSSEDAGANLPVTVVGLPPAPESPSGLRERGPGRTAALMGGRSRQVVTSGVLLQEIRGHSPCNTEPGPSHGAQAAARSPAAASLVSDEAVLRRGEARVPITHWEDG